LLLLPWPSSSPQMAEMVTFMLTAVYAMSAFLRIREVYLNKGKTLTEKVVMCGAILAYFQPIIGSRVCCLHNN